MNGISFYIWGICTILIFVVSNFFTKKHKKVASILVISIFFAIITLVAFMFSKVTNPALQSIWFVPHVAFYIFSYACLSAAFLFALEDLIFNKREVEKSKLREEKCSILVKIGFISLTLGLCFGAIWAKKAWGQFWSWDTKDIASLATWLIYVLYFQLRKIKKISPTLLYIILIIGFLAIHFTWWGINFLPTSFSSPHSNY